MKNYFICILVLASEMLFFSDSLYSQKLQVIELRNYLIQDGLRDRFIDTFKVYIEDSQNARGAFVTGKYHVKDAANNFFWIRGFENMPARKNALEGFYNSEYWSKTKRVSAGVVVNFDNVHLLQPLDSATGIDASWFRKKNGVTVIDFYIANGRRKELIDFFNLKYRLVLQRTGASDISYWVCEDEHNNYPSLPMFQDENLVVVIRLFDNEKVYREGLKRIPVYVTNELLGIETVHQTLVLYPSD